MIAHKSLATTLLASAMCLALVPGAVLAKNDHSGSHGNSANAHGSNGSVASELKSMNSAHASQNARDHAAPNSRVGMDAAYQTASLAVSADQQTLADAQSAYDALAASYTGPSSTDIQSQIDALDPTSPTYSSDLATLQAELTTAQTYETQLATLQQGVTDAQTALQTDQATQADALNTVSGGRTLSDAALAFYNSLLGL